METPNSVRYFQRLNEMVKELASEMKGEKMSRPIDANKIVYTEFPNTSEGLAFRSLIDKMPTIDAVEVVRCKDCENYIANDKYVMCGLRCEYTDKDWFCGNGIKRKDQNEAEPIKHGHWILQTNGHGMCSTCGTFVDLLNGMTWEYCPNCGAKMTGESIDNIVTNKVNTVTNNGNAMSTETRGETMPVSMMFPETVDEFMEQYKIVDSDEVYTNGAELVPIFRMKQWFEHVDTEPKHAYVIVDEDGNMECSNCGSSFCFDNYCGHCGAKLIGERNYEVEDAD